MARRYGVVPTIAVACGVVLVGGAVGSQVNVNMLVNEAASSAPLLRDYVGRFTQTTAGRDTLLHETLALVEQGGLHRHRAWCHQLQPLQAQQASVAFEAHSDFTASIAERGLIGGIGLFLLLLVIAFNARLVLGPIRPRFAAVLRHPGALAGLLVAYAVTANIYELLHFDYLWTALAVSRR